MKESKKNEFLSTLQKRIEKNPYGLKGADWKEIQKRLEKNPEKLNALWMMEESGGAPDLVIVNQKSKEFVFMDCSLESPAGRRSLCYDEQALKARKEHRPKNSAIAMAREMGIELLDEDQYLFLQSLGDFDLKTSSWIKTPESIRKLDGALFGDKRFNRAFIYHNGAQSYYAARGFRGLIKV